MPKNFSSFTNKNDKEILYPFSIATSFENSDVVLCIFLGFSIFYFKKTSTADDRLLQKNSTIGFVWFKTRNRL